MTKESLAAHLLYMRTRPARGSILCYACDRRTAAPTATRLTRPDGRVSYRCTHGECGHRFLSDPTRLTNPYRLQWNRSDPDRHNRFGMPAEIYRAYRADVKRRNNTTAAATSDVLKYRSYDNRVQ